MDSMITQQVAGIDVGFKANTPDETGGTCELGEPGPQAREISA